MQPTLFTQRHSLAILLIVVLLAAQWVGLKHRIIHGSGLPVIQLSGASAVSSGGHWDDKVHHSCVAFEAASVGAAVASASFAMPILPNRHVLALWIAFASWQAPHTSYFSSRAPPA